MSKKDLEAALFVSKEATTIESFAEILKEDKRVIIRWMYELINEYSERGIIIKQVGGGFEMVSSPDCFDTVSQIVPKDMETLPPASLETVTIVAYKQPVKRAEIAKMRNIQNPDHGIALSLEKGLIREIEDGFITTDLFLEFFGINDLHELPIVEVKTDYSEPDDVDNSETTTNDFEVISHNDSETLLDKAATEFLNDTATRLEEDVLQTNDSITK